LLVNLWRFNTNMLSCGNVYLDMINNFFIYDFFLFLYIIVLLSYSFIVL
jgi:hypothetical protein